MEMPLHQWSSTFFTYITTKSCQKRWKPSVAYLNLPITDFLFLCYLQQLFICSESANSRLKNTILVTHTVFHLAPLTLLTKKDAVYFREKVVSKVSCQRLFCFHAISKYNPFSSGKKICLMLLFVPVTTLQFRWWCCKMQYTWLCNSFLCQNRYGQGMAGVAQCDKHEKK